MLCRQLRIHLPEFSAARVQGGWLCCFLDRDGGGDLGVDCLPHVVAQHSALLGRRANVCGHLLRGGTMTLEKTRGRLGTRTSPRRGELGDLREHFEPDFEEGDVVFWKRK